MTLTMYVSDLKPDLVYDITSPAGPVNLVTGATSVRVLGRLDGTLLFDRVPTMAVVGSGTRLTMLWQPGDTNTVGRIEIETEITWPGNKKETVRLDGDVVIRQDFDAAALAAAVPAPLATTVSDTSINAVLVLPGGASRATVTTMVQDAVATLVPGTELGFAERTTNFAHTQTAAGASALVPGLVVTVTGKGRPADIVFSAQAAIHSVANTGIVCYLEVNGSVTAVQAGSSIVSSPSTTQGRGFVVRRRAVLTDGVVYTFKAGLYGAAAGTTTLVAATFAAAELSVTSR